jgi:hypothetical protein
VNNLQRANGREQDRAYGLLRGGREGALQCVAGVRLDTCQRVCAVYSSPVCGTMGR